MAVRRSEARLMKCPGCGEWVPSTQATCPKCNFDLAILHTVDELRTALRLTRTDSDNIANRIRQLEDKVSSLEPLVISKFAPPAPDPTEIDEQLTEIEAPPLPVEQAVDEIHAEALPTNTTPWASPHTRRGPSSVLSREGEIRFGQKWLLIVGIVITVLAIGYFLKYSFDRNWVGPAGRVSLAYLAGLAMLGTGEILRRRGFDLFGLYLIGGSIAVLYFACYAAFQIYNLFSQPIAFGLMVIVTFFAGLLAVFYDTKWLAVLGIVGGFLTPVVLSTGTDNQIALMTYMVILNVGILAIASFKRWHLLNYLGLSFTWLLFSVWYATHYSDTKFWTTTVFLNIFFLTYSSIPFVYYFVRRSQERVVGFAITIPNAFTAFGFSFVTIRNHFWLEMVGVVTVAYAAIFFSMATYLYRKNRENLEAFVLLLAKGMLFLIITVPILFSEHWITVFWAVQGIVLMWAAVRLSDSRIRVGAVLLLLVSVGKLFFYDYTFVFDFQVLYFSFRGGFDELLFERWATVGVSVAVLLVAGRMLKTAGFEQPDWRENYAGLFFGLFAVTLFLAMNIEVAGFFHDAAPRARFASISVLWALFASVLMVLGFAKNLFILRRVAIVLFAATVLKVFIRDMANIETPYRILSFLVVGLLLVAASFLYHRYSAQILPPPNEETTEQ